VVMQSSAGFEPIRPPAVRTCTRMATNHDWCRRGDNTKYRGKK
jgi:hypothetical protein